MRPQPIWRCRCWRRRRRKAPKIITTLHGTDTTLLGQDPSYRPAIEHALSHSDALTTVSESLRQETLATFQLRRPVEVIYNFFEPAAQLTSREEVRKELGLTNKEFLVVHSSNLRRPKRIDLLLRSFAAAQREQMRLLVLAGSSFRPYEELLDELGLRERVIVRESVNEVEDYLAAGDAGLYTSDNESFGLSILETLFHGKPVVAFRVGGIPEVVIDGECGFLHPFGEIEPMARSLAQLADAPELAQRNGRARSTAGRAKFHRGSDRAGVRAALSAGFGIRSGRRLALGGHRSAVAFKKIGCFSHGRET